MSVLRRIALSEQIPVLSRRALNRVLLARQLLLQRVQLTTEAAIAHLVGMQGQAPNPPYLGLWTRLTGFELEELAQLMLDRAVVRIALMRGTIHLVTAADAHGLRHLLQPMLEQGFASSTHAKLLPGLDLGPVAVAGRVAVDEQPRTFAELGAVLRLQWPDRDPSALAQVVRAHVPLVQVPPRGVWGRGGQARHTSLGAWVGAAPDRPPRLDDMVLRYLCAFGPASVADAQTWSGLTRLQGVFDRLSSQLRLFHDENGVELYDLPDAPRPDPDVHVPVRLLPEFDNVLLSHADRSRIIAEDDRWRLFTVNGIIPGSLLLDGFVRGLWKITRQRGAATLAITPFRRLTKRESAAVTAEARRLLAFAAAEDKSRDVVIADP